MTTEKLIIQETVLDGLQVGPVVVNIDPIEQTGKVLVEDSILDGAGSDIIIEVSNGFEVTNLSDLTELIADVQATAAANTAAAISIASSVEGATTAQMAAETAETNAETAETNAETAETNAGNSATASANSAMDSANSATDADDSATEAANSATASANSASDSDTSRVAAETAQTNAETAETNAETAETNAGTSATAASNSATSAGNSATAAGNSVTAANTARTGAETAQTNAETAETNAETAETNAETAETNAETAQAASETARDASIVARDAASASSGTATIEADRARTEADRAAASALTASNAIMDRGPWDASTGNFPTPTLTPNEISDWYRISVAGTMTNVNVAQPDVQVAIGDNLYWDKAADIWYKIDNTDQVMSVNGDVGAVTVTPTSIQAAPAIHQHVIGNVTGLQTAIDSKANADVAVEKLTATGPIDVQKGTTATRPNTSGAPNNTKALFWFNETTGDYEAYNPSTNEWGSVGGGGIPPINATQTTNFTFSRNNLVNADLSVNSNLVGTVPASLAIGSWVAIVDQDGLFSAAETFEFSLSAGETFTQLKNGVAQSKLTINKRNAYVAIRKVSATKWDIAAATFGQDADYFASQLAEKGIFELYNDTAVAPGSNVPLNDSVNNYDAIVVYGRLQVGSNIWGGSSQFSPDELTGDNNFISIVQLSSVSTTSSYASVNVELGESTQTSLRSSGGGRVYTALGIYKVEGIRY